MLGALTSLTGGGGLSASSSATSRAGDASVGGFNFAPGGKIPTVAWVVIGLVAAVVLLKVLR